MPYLRSYLENLSIWVLLQHFFDMDIEWRDYLSKRVDISSLSSQSIGLQHNSKRPGKSRKYPHNILLWKTRCLTTECLPWLHTSWRDSGYERFTMVWKTNFIRQTERQLPSLSYNHNTTAWQPSEHLSLQLHFKVGVRNFHVSRWFLHRVVSVLWL